jgi:CelD/BcsL family acetyltransferase involved in cellulose biosynthesis
VNAAGPAIEYRSYRDYERVREAFTALEANATYHFQTAGWRELVAEQRRDVNWIVASGAQRPLAAICVRRDVRRHKGVAFTVISEPVIGDRDFPGGEGLADPEGAAALELEAVVDATGAWDALLMRRVRVASPWLAFAHGDGVEVAAERGPAAGAGVIDTSRTAGEYWSDTPKKFRRGMSNARNRAQRSGGVTSTAASGAGFEAAYDALLRLEDSGWKGRAGDSLVHRDADAANLRRFTPGAAGGAVHLLAIGGQTVAAALCVTVGRSRVALKFAYDEAHADLSPGKLILAEIIEAAARTLTSTVSTVSRGGPGRSSGRWSASPPSGSSPSAAGRAPPPPASPGGSSTCANGWGATDPPARRRGASVAEQPGPAHSRTCGEESLALGHVLTVLRGRDQR